MVFVARLPGEKEQPDRIKHLLGEPNSNSLPFHDHAPRHPGVRVDAVGLQRNRRFAQGRVELGSPSGAEDEGAVVDLVVDREDIRVVFRPDGEAPHRDAAQEFPALLRLQDLRFWC